MNFCKHFCVLNQLVDRRDFKSIRSYNKLKFQCKSFVQIILVNNYSPSRKWKEREKENIFLRIIIVKKENYYRIF